MANGILKGLAVAAGTGLAMGFASAKTTGRTRLVLAPRPIHYSPNPLSDSSASHHVPTGPHDVPTGPHDVPGEPRDVPGEPEDEFLNIEPLLDRVERLEELVESLLRAPAAAPRASAPVVAASAPVVAASAPVVAAPAPATAPATAVPSSDYAAALDDLERRLDENARELALLRERIEEAERRAADSAAATRRSVEETRAEIPALIERHVEARLDNLRNHFADEIEQSHHRMLETFERAIDEKISSRIGSIERTLAEQAGSIEALTVRSTETDNNLQRLVSAIEKLCERAQWTAAPDQNARQQEGGAFESHFRDAMGRDPVVPVVRKEDPAVTAQVQAPAFTGIGDPAQKKPRFLFRNLIVAGFSVLASRLFR